MAKVERIFVDGVEVGSRHRTANPEKVAELAESMKRLGQLQPITVFTEDNERVLLVAGLHRLRAASKLGWDMLDAIFVTGDEIERELMEIAENLHRADLTALQRSEQVARWVELAAASFSQSAKNPKGGRPTTVGVSAAERELGIKKDDASRAAKVASLSDDAKAAAIETGLDDNRSALLDAAKQPVERQADYLRQRSAHKAEDNDLAEDAAEKVAALIAEHVPGEYWDGLKANLHATSAKAVARALTRLTGVAVFDSSRSGEAA